MSRVIPRKVLDDIRFRNDIVDVIGSYFELKRAGASYKALCPFHKEKTPSFHVNPQRQIFHCFGCGAGGDVFRFVMQHESVDFTTAAKMLAQRAGVVVELEEDGEAGEDKAVLYRIHEAVTEFYRRCLQTASPAEVARAYLARRKLDAAAAEAFRIGYAPNRWDAMEQWAEKHKHRIEDLERGGLVVRNTKPGGHRFYDRFRHRVMFPVCDEQGRVIAFSGRLLEEDAKEAKYVNSPDSPLFHKNRTLYALDKARKPIVEAREAIVCEGQIDVIRCHLAGFTTAVASQGTAFTEEHARILRRYADSVCLVYDGDQAGQDAAIRTSETFLDAGLAVRVVSLPEGEDPDSFLLKSGPEKFRKAIEASQSAVGFLLSVLSSREDTTTEVGTMRATKAVLRMLGHSPNPNLRSRMVEDAAERLRLPPSVL
jgi:DNA primase